MFEVMVRWTEADIAPGSEDIYSFQTEAEAKAFQLGLIEAETKLDGCPTIHEIQITKWRFEPKDDLTTEHLPSLWLQLLFSMFIGGWSAFWWHIFNHSNVFIEYLLIGIIATFLSYTTLLLFTYKSRKNNSDLL